MSTTLRTLILATLLLASPYAADAAWAQQAGPTTAAATAGYHALSSNAHDISLNAANPNAAVDAVLLVGGGAALVIGVVIGGTAGIVLAVAGAIIAVIGLVLLLS